MYEKIVFKNYLTIMLRFRKQCEPIIWKSALRRVREMKMSRMENFKFSICFATFPTRFSFVVHLEESHCHTNLYHFYFLYQIFHVFRPKYPFVWDKIFNRNTYIQIFYPTQKGFWTKNVKNLE